MSTLETQIALEVGRVITNASNFPEPMRVHMWGRDLAGPIEKITAALAPVIAEREAAAWDACADALKSTIGAYAEEGLWALERAEAHHPNPYRSNDE